MVHKDSLSAATNEAIFPKLAGRVPTLWRGAMRDKSTSTSFGHLRNLLERCPVDLNTVPSTGSKKGGPEEQRRS